MSHQWKNLSFALAAMLVGALVTGVVMSLPQGLRSDAYAQQQGASIAAQQNLSTARDLSTSFRNVADALKPSVVSISTTQKIAVRGRVRSQLPPGLRRQLPPGFEDLFGFGEQDLAPRSQPQREGMGSGVIVRPDGFILTNNHVVEGADELTVELSDGRKVPGNIVGTDPETDLAVIKIELTGLQPAVFGSSDDIRVGDWVLAIGSPFGLDQTVTAGIISGKNRVQGIVDDGNGFEDFLQTDAAINPGNSGGPLVNLRGELVGINTAILSRSGASAGIGFAIPVSLARPVLDSIVESGVVRRGFLGAAVDEVDADLIEKYDLKVNQRRVYWQRIGRSAGSESRTATRRRRHEIGWTTVFGRHATAQLCCKPTTRNDGHDGRESRRQDDAGPCCLARTNRRKHVDVQSRKQRAGCRVAAGHPRNGATVRLPRVTQRANRD